MIIFVVGGGSPVGTLATIPIGQASSHFRRLALWITPSTALTYSVDYERDITDLVNAKDEPVIPERFHRLLPMGARMKEYEKREDDVRALRARREFDKEVGKLKYFVAAGMDVRPVMGRRTIQRPSQLGGWYESGT